MDIRTDITTAIINLIEQGGALGEGCLWDAAGRFGMPINYRTQREYSGVNVLLLLGEVHARGLERNEWLTFKQALELGAKVKKGAKGVMGVFCKMLPKKGAADAQTTQNDASPQHMAAMLKPFWVFNVADIEGLPEVVQERPAFEPIVERTQPCLARANSQGEALGRPLSLGEASIKAVVARLAKGGTVAALAGESSTNCLSIMRDVRSDEYCNKDFGCWQRWYRPREGSTADQKTALW